MTDFNYGDIIEYIDCSFDEQFESAKHWCEYNNAQLVELVEWRKEKDGVLYRYFEIRKNPNPLPPTEDEMKASVRSVRNEYLQETDFTQLSDAPFTIEEKAQYAQYRQYLRDYTNSVNWWLQNPKTFEEWKD